MIDNFFMYMGVYKHAFSFDGHPDLDYWRPSSRKFYIVPGAEFSSAQLQQRKQRKRKDDSDHEMLQKMEEVDFYFS